MLSTPENELSICAKKMRPAGLIFFDYATETGQPFAGRDLV
jgi:hypothetical protein